MDGRREEGFPDLVAREAFPFQQQYAVSGHGDQGGGGRPAGSAADHDGIELLGGYGHVRLPFAVACERAGRSPRHREGERGPDG